MDFNASLAKYNKKVQCNLDFEISSLEEPIQLKSNKA